MTYSIDLRETALSYINNGGNRVEVCRVFGCTRNTLYRWSKMDDLRPKKHGSRQRKIDMKALRRHVEGESDMFLQPHRKNIRKPLKEDDNHSRQTRQSINS